MRCPTLLPKCLLCLIVALAILSACGSRETRQEPSANAAAARPAFPAQLVSSTTTTGEPESGAAAETDASPTSGTENGLLYGPGFSFWAKPPAGWVLDTESGAEQGLAAVFYPTGSSFADSKAVMYINTTSKEDDPTLENLFEDDIGEMRKNSPDLVVTPGEPIAMPGGAQAKVNKFTGDQWGNFESVAYVDSPNVWVMFVLTARDEAAYQKALPAFVALVKSYQYVTSEVTVEK